MSDNADLRRRHDYHRRVGEVGWLLLSLFPIVVGLVASLFTGDFLYAALGIVFAIPSWVGWYRHRYVLYAPVRDPMATEEFLRAHAERRLLRAKKVAFANGIIMIIAAPLVGIATAEGPDGGFHFWDSLGGVVVGLVTMAAGIGAIAWSYRVTPELSNAD